MVARVIMAVFLFTLISLFTNVCLLLDSEFMKTNKLVPAAIIDQFPKHEIIIHYENATKPKLDYFLNNVNIDRPVTLLVNYDEGRALRRPVGYQFANIVCMNNPFRFGTFSGDRLNLEYGDAVIFVVDSIERRRRRRDADAADPWDQKGLNQSGCVILYEMLTNEFYYVRFYVGNTSGLLNKIPVKDDGDAPRLLEYFNKFENFNGHVFNVGYMLGAPFIMDVKCERSDDCKSSGIDSKLLHLLSGRLNFKFLLKTSETKEPKWTAMLDDVHNCKLDWAIGGITRSVHRMKIVDFTSMLYMERYAVVYADEKNAISNWDNSLTPLKIYVWLCLITMACLMGAFLKLTRIFVGRDTACCVDYVLIPFHTITEQSIYHLRLGFSVVKILLGMWFITSIIITTAYKSKLASSMITPMQNPPGSIIDLYKEGYTFQLDPDDSTVLITSLSEAIDVNYQHILSRSNNNLGLCAAMKSVLGGKIAFIEEETLLQYIIWCNCKRDLTLSEVLRLRKLKEELLPSYHAWPLQQHAPYRFRFSYVIAKLVASGIIDHWYKSTKRNSVTHMRKLNGVESSSLTITTFLGPAFVLLVGTAISLAVFLCELLYSYKTPFKVNEA